MIILHVYSNMCIETAYVSMVVEEVIDKNSSQWKKNNTILRTQ